MDDTEQRIATAHVDGSGVRYAQKIRLGKHELVADEPPPIGGADAGPAPYQLLLAALGACTSITLQMYAERKGWSVGEVHVDLAFVRNGDTERIVRSIRFTGEVTAEQRTRFGEIAEKTPVTKTVKRGTAIETTVV